MTSRVSNAYKIMGFKSGGDMHMQLQRKQLLKAGQKQAKRTVKRQQDFRTRVGISANKLQTHYRDPTGFVG